MRGGTNDGCRKSLLPYMIREILNFFRTEKLYSALLALVIVSYGWLYFQNRHSQPLPDDEATAVMDSYNRMEQRLQEEMERAGSVENYFRLHPKGQALFQAFMLGFFLLLGAGISLDMLLLFRPPFRERFSVRPAQRGFSWDFTWLVKFVILFFLTNLAVNLATAGLSRILAADWSENTYMLLNTTLVDIICFGVIYHFVSSAGGTPFDLGFGAPDGDWLREVTVGIGAYLAVLPVFFAILIASMLVAQWFSYRPPEHPLVEIFLQEEKRSPWLVGYSVFLATCAGPFFEEVFFRGFCYPIFRKRFGMILAMILSASLFALIHENSFSFWPIFVLGLALAYLYERRQSLVAPITLHVVHNGVFLVYFFLAKSFLTQAAGT